MDDERQKKECVFWDKYAKKYDNFMLKIHFPLESLIQKILPYVDESKNICEIATGTGLISFEIAPQCKEIYACDISEEMIKISKEKQKTQNVSNIEFSVQDAYELNYKHEFFDIVIISNALHVMIHPEKALNSINSVLKKDGILIASTFCHGNSMKTRFISSFMSLFGFKAFNKWSIESYKEFIESNNFEIIEYEIIKDAIPLAFAVAKKK
jgi:ubiquinone/menaquinone biosynthesis C-methylase UbiE